MTFYRKGSYIYFIERDEFEPDEHYVERCNFVASQQPKSKVELDNVIKYSYIFVNVKYLKSLYSPEIMNTLSGMIGRCHVEDI
jgi:hypothetical protein